MEISISERQYEMLLHIVGNSYYRQAKERNKKGKPPDAGGEPENRRGGLAMPITIIPQAGHKVKNEPTAGNGTNLKLI